MCSLQYGVGIFGKLVNLVYGKGKLYTESSLTFHSQKSMLGNRPVLYSAKNKEIYGIVSFYMSV